MERRNGRAKLQADDPLREIRGRMRDYMRETLSGFVCVMWHFSDPKLGDRMQMCGNKMKDGGGRLGEAAE